MSGRELGSEQEAAAEQEGSGSGAACKVQSCSSSTAHPELGTLEKEETRGHKAQQGDSKVKKSLKDTAR